MRHVLLLAFVFTLGMSVGAVCATGPRYERPRDIGPVVLQPDAALESPNLFGD